LTQLARNNMRIGWKEAGCAFKLSCGHRVKKGEKYLVINDYFAYNRYHTTKCRECANGKEAQ
jgi:hypothetical protein